MINDFINKNINDKNINNVLNFINNIYKTNKIILPYKQDLVNYYQKIDELLKQQKVKVIIYNDTPYSHKYIDKTGVLKAHETGLPIESKALTKPYTFNKLYQQLDYENKYQKDKTLINFMKLGYIFINIIMTTELNSPIGHFGTYVQYIYFQTMLLNYIINNTNHDINIIIYSSKFKYLYKGDKNPNIIYRNNINYTRFNKNTSNNVNYKHINDTCNINY